MATLNFNAANVEPATGFDVIPPGRYNVMIVDSDMVETKAGTGHYLKLTFKVLEGEYINRLIWANLNLDNPNPKAVEIAQRELSGICRACGLTEIDDSQELHGIPMSGQVKIQKGTGGYDDSNTISGFKPIDDAATGDAPASPPWA
jgi:hypothetical protein